MKDIIAVVFTIDLRRNQLIKSFLLIRTAFLLTCSNVFMFSSSTKRALNMKTLGGIGPETWTGTQGVRSCNPINPVNPA